jgi:hypothetical protein
MILDLLWSQNEASIDFYNQLPIYLQKSTATR